MNFSVVDLLPQYYRHEVIIVEEEGRVGMFSHIKFTPVYHYHAIQQNEGEIAVGCQSEIACLPVYYNCSILVRSAEGYIFFVGLPKDFKADVASFSLQVKTLKVEMVCQMVFESCNIHPYFGYPPFMSSRRI